MSNRVGAVAANVLSVGARILGFVLFYVLRISYRPRERLLALGFMALLILPILGYWLFR